VSLKGGDAVRGREVVFSHADAGCVRCHSIGGEGQAAVGPNLAGAAGRLDTRALLESLLDPAAKVSPGFAITTVTTRDGSAVAGWWMEETATTLTVKLPEGGTKTLDKSTIASQTPPISTMPPMGTVLTPRELRDVVAYLQTLK
jgi:putative heme-binding domain-containing protein